MTTMISLFSGIGGIDVAFAAVGFEITTQVEIDDFCREVLQHHAQQYWPNATQFTDVRDIGRTELGYQPTVLTAGFPCQPNSVAGKQKGATDSRNLWPDTRRIIGDIRPRCVFLENVPGILTTIGADVLADLAKMGYVGSAGIISAADAGAAHQRKRWFVVAYAEDKRLPQRINGKQWQGKTKTRSPLECDRPQRSGVNGSGRIAMAESRLDDATDGIPRWLVEHRQPALQGQNQYEWEAPRGITTQQKQAYHKDKIKALGNAVFPPTIYPIAKEIYKALTDDSTTT